MTPRQRAEKIARTVYDPSMGEFDLARNLRPALHQAVHNLVRHPVMVPAAGQKREGTEGAFAT
jgi:hypothetical protein